MSRFHDWTNGRWGEIVSALLGDQWSNTRKHHACPQVSGSTDCYRFSDKGGNGSYFCRCSEGEKGGFDLLQCRLGVDFMGAVRAVEGVIGPCPKDGAKPAPTASYAMQLLREGERSNRSRYLESRGLIVPPGLLFHRAAQYRKDGEVVATYPAIVAPITRDGATITAHVTYLQDGKKAPITPCRKILPGPSTSGGAVELWPAAEVMGVAEGIETAIAAAMIHQLPVWAALNTALMKSFTPPAMCKRLLIFADNDANFAGHAAAYALAHRMYGRTDVDVLMPDAGDWNDVLAEGGAVRAAGQQ